MPRRCAGASWQAAWLRRRQIVTAARCCWLLLYACRRSRLAACCADGGQAVVAGALGRAEALLAPPLHHLHGLGGQRLCVSGQWGGGRCVGVDWAA